MRTVCIIQARMGSSRLPGKVMKDLAGHPVLWHVVQRVRAVGSAIDAIVVATSTQPKDNTIAEQCLQWNVGCYRGSEQDVLTRYHEAATLYEADQIIRITADCPLLDSEILRSMIDYQQERAQKGSPPDYLSNGVPIRTFPQGFDCEIFTYSALRSAACQAIDPYEREHVTPFLYRHPEKFSLALFSSQQDDSSYRWTLDTPQDYALIHQIYEALYEEGKCIDTQAVKRWLAHHPAWIESNKEGAWAPNPLRLRPLEKRDKEILFHWRNLPHIRNSMNTRHVISWEEHDHWFTTLPPDTVYLICEVGDIPIGIVNFKQVNLLEKSASWGVYLGWQDLPRGTGTHLCEAALQYARKMLKLERIYAEVRANNPASLRLHKKLGFKVTHKDEGSYWFSWELSNLQFPQVGAS